MTTPFHSRPELVATYRLQLRNGVGLAEAQAMLPCLTDLGVSHLYLSPLFRAATRSTHGYDVLDPNEVDPVLGGEEGFIALSDAALEAGIGLVLDIVPNHMAFTPENPFVADIMRQGRRSRFAQVFDIDWDQGPLHFPFLDRDPHALLAAGEVILSADGDVLRVQGLDYPLRDTPLARELAACNQIFDAAALSALLQEQVWTIGDWRATAGAIIHRRFFNISGLIGVRQEEPAVFALTHRWIVEKVRAGRIQGLRIDHVDGLARPTAYLHRLRAAVGDIPLWVEKIVKHAEELPHGWPVEGMSGYEFLAPLTRLLTNEEGWTSIRAACAEATPCTSAGEVESVRRELLAESLGPELRRVTATAIAALGCAAAEAPDIARSVTELGAHWPVYRSYTADGYVLNAEFNALRRVEGRAGCLIDLLHAAADEPAASRFAARFEQLTGALTAKSEEDTVFFRAVSYLPFCEVGIGPDCSSIDASAFELRMQDRAAQRPLALNALSTHDTKRSADARAAIIALSYFPDLADIFIRRAKRSADALGLPERWGIYALQSALALRGEPQAKERLAQHIAKAMREAKDISSHEAPNLDAERGGSELIADLLRLVESDNAWPSGVLDRFEGAFESIVLTQVAFQMTSPGIPDIYQGNEWVSLGLTDPDNRRPIDPVALGAVGFPPGSLSARKYELTRELLSLRRRYGDLFTRGKYSLAEHDNGWTIARSGDSVVVEVGLAKPDLTGAKEWSVVVSERDLAGF
ncbi:malto-oligosyltrehalose synthase [Novosphingobium sp. BL-8H]|uniref:malto-oligosyltrehalose synthase n=1 Tax=Novosphingobium sp. BL-8H TaxID=3127640 RepID=UPI003756B6B7